MYKIKYKANGIVEFYKARLVAKGYKKHEDIDFLGTFSYVAKLVTVKLLPSLSTIFSWSLAQLDMENAFLHEYLIEEVLMNVPLGYSCRKGENLPPNAVCRLHKSIYGLRQTYHQWLNKFSTVLLEIGFVQSTNDHSLFIKSQGSVFLAPLVYVDDIIITSNNMADVTDMKFSLSELLKVRDLDPLKYFLE